MAVEWRTLGRAAGFVLGIAVMIALLAQLRPEAEKTFSRGDELAKYLVEAAKKNAGVVDLKFLGSKVCVEPPGGLAKPSAESLHGKPVLFEESDASEGFWFLSIDRGDGVYIYAVPFSIIAFQASEDKRFSDLKFCATELFLDLSKSVPVLQIK